jgi:GNAT superfamily N-acetyltransferase
LSDRPNWFERVVASLVAVAMELVRGILMAPLVALRRALMPLRVESADAEAVIPLRHRILRPGHPRAAAEWDSDHDASTRHWAARWGGEVVGVVTVIRNTPPDAEAPEWQLRGMAMAPDVQGRGVGAQLLEEVHRAVDAPMWCNAREHALGFYERFGWEARGERFDKPPAGPHFRMFWNPKKLPAKKEAV